MARGRATRAESGLGELPCPAMPCFVLPWREGVFGTASASGLCLPREFSAGRRSSSASAGGDRIRGVLSGCLYRERGREVFVTSCCVSRKPQECSFSGLPWNADFLGGGRFLKKRVEGPRSLDELRNGKSRNCVSSNWLCPGGIWR